MKTEDLIREYRPSMSAEVLHDWAKDVVKVMRDAQALIEAAEAYKQATVPLEALKAAERAAYARKVDSRGVVIGGREEAIAYTAALDALDEQEHIALRARQALTRAALSATEESA